MKKMLNDFYKVRRICHENLQIRVFFKLQEFAFIKLLKEVTWNIFSNISAEHLRDWRPRYFILKDNGEFIGYKKEPSTEEELNKILNNFTVKNCEIILTDRPKKFTFSIRGLHLTTVVERTFHAESEEER